MDRTHLIKALEALIFVSGDPLPIERIYKVFEPEGVERHEIREALDSLKRDYLGRGVEIVEIGGGYQMRTSPEMSATILRLDAPKPSKLSQAAMETLAIIAYRQPITRAEIEEVRGVDVGAVARSLLERGLIKVVGKKDVPGRPLLYGTTKEFLEVFGLSSLTDLPTLRQIEEMVEEDEAPEPEPKAMAETYVLRPQVKKDGD